MRASYDFRDRTVRVAMSRREFIETVEWLETVDPHDGATKDWREELDRLFPSEPDAGDD
jgi:hypothetical protein